MERLKSIQCLKQVHDGWSTQVIAHKTDESPIGYIAVARDALSEIAMKLGVSAFAWTAGFGTGHLPLIAQVREYGFDGMEIPMFVPSALPAADLRKEFEANDLECTVCAILPAGINPISQSASVRKKSLAHLVECVETAAEMGAHLLGGPIFAPIGYFPGHRPTEDERKWAIEMFQSVGDLIEKHAIDLSIEPVNRSETFFIRTAAEAKEFCEDVGHPCIGVTVDTYHANIEEKSVPGAIDPAGIPFEALARERERSGRFGNGACGCSRMHAGVESHRLRRIPDDRGIRILGGGDFGAGRVVG